MYLHKELFVGILQYIRGILARKYVLHIVLLVAWDRKGSGPKALNFQGFVGSWGPSNPGGRLLDPT